MMLNVFMCLLVICVSLDKCQCVYSNLLHIFSWVICFFLLLSFLSVIFFASIVCHFLGGGARAVLGVEPRAWPGWASAAPLSRVPSCVFHFLDEFSLKHSGFNFDATQFIFFVCCLCFDVMSEKLSSNARS
jgi:hypothetical protein